MQGVPLTVRISWGFTIILWLGVVLIVSTSACSTTPKLAEMPEPTTIVESIPAKGGQVRVAVASKDLAVGLNRLVFGVLDDVGPVRSLQVTAKFVFVDHDPIMVLFETGVTFVEWPGGKGGVYVADDVEFDEAGRWGMIVEVVMGNGDTLIGQSGFVVSEHSSSPAVGAAALLSANKTASDVVDLSELTSSPTPDPGLYEISIVDAVGGGRPVIVTFAAPAYCQTATCGPQVEVLSSLRLRHSGAFFIHVEVYANPHEIQGDLSRARISPLMEEWGLMTEPYTFVINSEGRISAKFEGFVTEQELETALLSLLHLVETEGG